MYATFCKLFQRVCINIKLIHGAPVDYKTWFKYCGICENSAAKETNLTQNRNSMAYF